MKSVGKALVGAALVAALLCLARVIMYGPGSLPFMNSFNTTQTNSSSEAKPAGAAPDTNVGSVSSSAPNPPQAYRSSPPSGQGGGQASPVPNPPSMYERARRAGNRPNTPTDE